MNTQTLWNLIKTTLIEKDGTNTVYGSIKRWLAWILAALVIEVVNAGLMPGGSIHIGTFINFAWNHTSCDKETLAILLKAIGTYVLGGATLSMIGNSVQNYHNQKFSSKPPQPASPADNKE